MYGHMYGIGSRQGIYVLFEPNMILDHNIGATSEHLYIAKVVMRENREKPYQFDPFTICA